MGLNMGAATGNQSLSLCLLCLFFVVIIPTLQADIAEYDEYWRERELQAKENLEKEYNPKPEEVTNHLNDRVATTLMGLGSNSTTRRALTRKIKRMTPCEATNPIDQCWRCDPNWEKNRKRLADCALGFGRDVTGGKNGAIYVVTNSSDDVLNPAPGTLRHAVTRNVPLWIIFARGMIIRLKEELIMTCDKTIDGRGANVHIAYGASFTIQFIKNVIIHNIHIHHIIPGNGGLIQDGANHIGLRTRSDGDGVSIFGATNIWLDHLSIYKCSDGIVDIIQGSTAITISNCHITDHNDVMLFGASDSYIPDEKMQVTVAFNRFGKNLVQRMPRARFGFIHVVNNDYTFWNMYAIGGSSHPTIISQGNRFRAPRNIAAKEVLKREFTKPEVWKFWDWRSEGDVLLNGAIFIQSGSPNAIKKFAPEKTVKFSSGHKVPLIVHYSGALTCCPGKPC
ncbi:putative pectate lyase 7 [Hibiscus syriacus]|uniref:Pectate lyase n=1 Tax=Hibiscus syriacus TaxID=106335 RepID=A0A6A2XDF1_HIBSY|nr:pectate lyase-like [Hibiscus syriacus]KAE8665285.1 putative pectate lyase 7 [Hibiscus syriacus]